MSELEAWLREIRSRLSSKAETAKAIDYLLKRWPAFTRFLEDGRICLSNNAAERALRGIAVGRRNWTFAGSDAGGRRAAAIYTLIETAKLNDVDPRAWLADVLKRLPSTRPNASMNSCRGPGRRDSSSRQLPDHHGRPSVIDNPNQVEQLVGRLREALPIPAIASAPLLALLKERSPSLDLQPLCRVLRVDYAGDEGGIVCQLVFASEDGREVFFASITHLTFDRRLPLAREIATYQKHRIKHIRRGTLPRAPAEYR